MPQRYRPSARTAIERLERDIEALLERASAADPVEELAGDLCRYSCVRICGYLEQSLVQCARSLCDANSWGSVQEFALSWLEKAPNPRADALVGLVRRFSGAWGEELEAFLAENEYGTRINALVGIRNDIAHGKNQGVSIMRAREYFDMTRHIVAFLLARFEPLPGGVGGVAA
jgi:hypothetical protein